MHYKYRYKAGKKPDEKALYKYFTARSETEIKRKIKE